MSDPKPMSDLDRWVFACLTLVSLVLIGAAVATRDLTFLNYLSGPGSLVLLYFIFARG